MNKADWILKLLKLTETWLKSTILDTVVDIPGYNIMRRDWSSDNHGGVCLYIKDGNFRYKQVEERSCCADIEYR